MNRNLKLTQFSNNFQLWYHFILAIGGFLRSRLRVSKLFVTCSDFISHNYLSSVSIVTLRWMLVRCENEECKYFNVFSNELLFIDDNLSWKILHWKRSGTKTNFELLQFYRFRHVTWTNFLFVWNHRLIIQHLNYFSIYICIQWKSLIYIINIFYE